MNRWNKGKRIRCWELHLLKHLRWDFLQWSQKSAINQPILQKTKQMKNSRSCLRSEEKNRVENEITETESKNWNAKRRRNEWELRSLGIGGCACLSGFLRRKVFGSCGAILCGARCREFGWCLLLFHLAGSTICGFQFQLYL